VTRGVGQGPEAKLRVLDARPSVPDRLAALGCSMFQTFTGVLSLPVGLANAGRVAAASTDRSVAPELSLDGGAAVPLQAHAVEGRR
jgi:hypothetical protein